MEIKADRTTILFANLTLAVNRSIGFSRQKDFVLEVSPDDYTALLALRQQVTPDNDIVTFRGVPLESNDKVQSGTFRISHVTELTEDIFS